MLAWFCTYQECQCDEVVGISMMDDCCDLKMKMLKLSKLCYKDHPYQTGIIVVESSPGTNSASEKKRQVCLKAVSGVGDINTCRFPG